MKYLKTWMGLTSGSARDSGYPERKFRMIESLDELVNSYDGKAEYYKLEPVNVKSAVDAVKELN